MALWQKVAPLICAVMVPLLLGGNSLLIDAALKKDMEIPIFLLYKNAIASIVLVPLVIKYRSNLPPLTWKIFFQIIILGILGPGLENIGHAGSKLTPAPFSACVSSLVPPLTFLSSWIFQLETVHIQERPSQAKLLGTIIMTSGAIVSGIYGGPVISLDSTNHHSYLEDNWVRGPFLLLISLFTDVAYNMLLDRTVKIYYAPLAMAAYLCCIGAGINMGYAFISEGTSGLQWLWGLNIKMGTYFYSGLIVSGLTIYLQGWLTKQKGPIFFISFSPLSTIFIVVVGTLILKEDLQLGMLIGVVTVIFGLGIFLWGESQGSSLDEDQNLEEVEESESSGEFHIAELFEEDEGQPSVEAQSSGSQQETLEDDESHEVEESSGEYHLVELFEEDEEAQPSVEAKGSGSQQETLEDDESHEVEESSCEFHIVELFAGG